MYHIGNSKLEKPLSFITKICTILLITSILLSFCGCGSADYFLEIGNDYAICRTSPEHRGIAYNPSENRNRWSARIQRYYVCEYFVTEEYIGLYGYFNWPDEDYYANVGITVEQQNLNTSTFEDPEYAYYLLKISDDTLMCADTEEAFVDLCKSVGINTEGSIEWLDPDEVARAEGLI